MYGQVDEVATGSLQELSAWEPLAKHPRRAAASWMEQRIFNELAARALEAA